MKTKYILHILFFLNSYLVVAQDTLSVKDIYFYENLAYLDSNDKLFTGITQKVRKNGHVVYEEEYDRGVILEWRSYYNKSNRRIAEKMVYYKDLPFTRKRKIRYQSNKGVKFTTSIFYDTNELKILETRHQDTILIYRCSYKNGKKDGLEFCFDDNGNRMTTQFSEGKRVKG